MPKKHAMKYLPLRETIAKTHRALYEMSEHLSAHEQNAALICLTKARTCLDQAWEQLQYARTRP